MVKHGLRTGWRAMGGLALVAAAACGGDGASESGAEVASAVSVGYSNLERRGFCNNSAACWSSCSSIAYNSNNCGANSNGAPAPPLHTTFTAPVSGGGDPATGRLWVGQTSDGSPWGDAYFYTQLGAGYPSNISRFQYSTEVFVAGAEGSYQGMEWDGNWFYGGHHYVFGLKDDRRGSGTWRYFVPNVGWRSTGVPSTPLAGRWVKVAASFIVSGANAYLESFTVDGVIHLGHSAWKASAVASGGNKATFGLSAERYLTDEITAHYRNVNVTLQGLARAPRRPES